MTWNPIHGYRNNSDVTLRKIDDKIQQLDDDGKICNNINIQLTDKLWDFLNQFSSSYQFYVYKKNKELIIEYLGSYSNNDFPTIYKENHFFKFLDVAKILMFNNIDHKFSIETYDDYDDCKQLAISIISHNVFENFKIGFSINIDSEVLNIFLNNFVANYYFNK